ncbi:MAG: LacI family DNA-binding transcriptional regulator [Armatimonadota bacterium]|nr:LacI family transcriptional regulator [bacterium]
MVEHFGPSITDVAKLAGVGKGTVSRVLNDRPGVSHKTETKVRQAMRELGYSPNVQARRLARNVSDLICFVLSNRDFLHEFHSMVLKGVENYCSSAERDLVFALWRYELDPLPDVVVPPRIVSGRGSVDGVILAGVNHVDCAKMVAGLGVHCVSVGNNMVGCKSISEVDSVWYDEAIGTHEAIGYLAGLGHRHIRFLATTSLPWFTRNYRAFSDAMIDYGLAPMATWINGTTDYNDIAERGVKEILESGTRPTAIFAGNDSVAAAVVQSLERRGIRVPRDMSVVGFDDTPRCLEIEPHITTVSVPKEELGVVCARFLIQKISSLEPVTGARVIPTKLVIRDSCSKANDIKV